jgi:hypothetical protein
MTMTLDDVDSEMTLAGTPDIRKEKILAKANPVFLSLQEQLTGTQY